MHYDDRGVEALQYITDFWAVGTNDNKHALAAQKYKDLSGTKWPVGISVAKANK